MGEEQPEEPAPPAVEPAASMKLPKGTYFLLAQTFPVTLGMFSTNGIFPLYLRNKLKFSTDFSVAILHAMKSLVALFLPIGALLSSSFANRFVLLIGGDTWQTFARSLLFAGSFPVLRAHARQLTYAFWGLHFTALVILAGVFAAFEGDQFKLPEQHNVLIKYYHLDYIFRNVSILTAFFLIPLMKTEIPCLGEQDCYPIAFGASVMFYIIEVTFLLLGTKYYVKKKPHKNMVGKVWSCTKYAASTWMRERKTNPMPHWLDYSQPVYGAQLVKDIKCFLKILTILATLPVVWSLYHQMLTKWLFQATRMNGRVGSYTIIPDHFQLLNPVIVLTLLPLVIKFVDPHTEKWGMKRTLRRMVFGGSVLALAFILAGIVESQIKTTSPEMVLPKENESELRIFNGLNCSYVIYASDVIKKPIESRGLSIVTVAHVPLQGYKMFNITGLVSEGSCDPFTNRTVFMMEQRSVAIYISDHNGIQLTAYEEPDKPETGFPQLTVLGADVRDEIIVRDSNYVEIMIKPGQIFVDGIYPMDRRPRIVEVVPDKYSLIWRRQTILSEFDMHLGGVYAIMLHENYASMYEIHEPYTVHIFWLLPQAFLFSIAEIYFVISQQDFRYSEAPTSLKSVVCATAEFTEGIGDAIITLVTLYGNLDQDHEFFLFSTALILDMGILTYLALHFEPLNANTKLF